MTNNDPHQQPGSLVNNRATIVTPEAECKRLFGLLWKRKRVTASLVSIEIETSTRRSLAFVNADWSIQDPSKRLSSKLFNVKPGEACESGPEMFNGIQTCAAVVELPNRQPSEGETREEANKKARVVVRGVSKEVHGNIWTNLEVLLPLNG